jgi:hypothetical protein
VRFCIKGWQPNQEKLHPKISQLSDTQEINVMNEMSKTPLIIAFVVIVVLFLIFGGGAMTGSMMSGGMMGHGRIAGMSWMWIPTLLTLCLGILLGWVIFGKK